MKSTISRSLCFTLLGSMAVGVVPTAEDSSDVALHLSTGGGKFASIVRGCEGEVLAKEEVSFSETSAALSYQGRSPLRAGLRGSYLAFAGSDAGITTISPHVTLDFEHFALGGGYTFASDPLPWGDGLLAESSPGFPGGHLRIGSRRTQYADLSVLQSDALCSDGYVKLGFGSDRGQRVGWWFGVTTGPYDGWGFAGRADIRVRRHLYVNTAARLGDSEGIPEFGFRAGLTYRMGSAAPN